jgi:PAS domain S-box-containing protein
MEVFSSAHSKFVPEFLQGGGEQGQRIREFNWSSTPLGPVESWPKSLRTCVQIMLMSRQPIWIGWGSDLIKLYNDPYKAIAGGKHPWALGKPASVVWRDIWTDIEPMLRKVMHENEGTYVESQLLIMERNGYPEETHYTFSYTPIAGDSGRTEGMICFNTDDTERIIGERQLYTLSQLGKSLTDSKTNAELFQRTMGVLADNPYDFSFAVVYQQRDQTLELINSTALGDASGIVRPTVDLDAADEFARLSSDALEKMEVQLMEGVTKKVGDLPMGAWKVAPDKLLILPISQTGGISAYGVLVVGLNPYRLLDDKYRSLVALIGDQVATSLVNIHAMETERKRLETLAELDRAKTLFFSNISHEFRTPLTLLLGPMEDLLADPSIKGENREKADVALRNALRMQKLVNLLLDFSRIEANKMEPKLSPVDVAELTADFASNFRTVIERAGMELVLDFEPIEETVYLDVDMWEKVVLNLLSNAFKYSEAGRIVVSIRKGNGTVEVSVADTGVGIPASEIDHIFDRFHRVQSVRGRSQEGTGIGLAMVKELVRLHGGTIHVQSTEGTGSIFTVTLPLVTTPPAKKMSAILQQQGRPSAYVEEASKWTYVNRSRVPAVDMPSSRSSVKTKPKVLIADDNADMRMFVGRLLEKDYDIFAVSDGEEAYNTALQVIPDLILSDIMMPRLDGFQLLKKLKENLSTTNIPLIFLSARAGEEAKVEGLYAGADDYLIKPFSSKELLARVASHISTSKTRRRTEKEFYNLFIQSPAHIHVMRGPEHVVEFFHPLGIPFAGRDITGMKMREALPFLEGQGFFEMLDKVYYESAPIYLNEQKAVFKNSMGEDVNHYFNITYLPWKDLDGKTQGVLQFSFEVTDNVNSRLKSEASEKRLQSIAGQAPVAMALMKGSDFIMEMANERMLSFLHKSESEVIGKPAFTLFPEARDQGFMEIVQKVYHKGEAFVALEMPLVFEQQEKRKVYMNLLYEPFRNSSGEIEGVLTALYDVSEQVVARNKVAEAELKFRTIIEQTPSPLCIFKGENMLLEVANEAALQVWQVGAEVIGKTLVEIVPEMQRQVFLELMLDVYKNNVTRYGYEAPAYFIRKDGVRENRFFNFIYTPYQNAEKETIGVLVLATDVTEQVLAKKQLTENEERLRIAGEILELGTWEYDPINDAIYCSPKSCELLSLNATAKISLDEMIAVVDENDQDRVRAAVSTALRGENEGKIDIEFATEPTSGESRVLRSTGQAFFDSGEVANRFIGTLIDITKHKEAADKIIASEARFRILTTSIPQIVWTTDKDGNSTYFSGQFERYTGLNPEASLTRWQELVHPDDLERLMRKRRYAIEHGEPWQEEFRLKNFHSGAYRWFLANANPLKDHVGNVTMYIGAASDIQDLKEQSVWLEKQVLERTRSLKELNQSLKASNEDLQQFAHVASHDLKEPIRKIKTYSSRLRDEYNDVLPPNAAAFLSKIHSATDRMYAMIDGVLAYSTLTSSEMPREAVDLNETLTNIRNDLEVLIQDKKAIVDVGPLPTIFGSPILLYQLFYNLLNNSLKFSKSDVIPVITISSALLYVDKARFEKVILRDNGIGFDQEDAERIFTTFTRLNSKDRYEGTGLGLALCKKIVHRHGGLISAKSQKGNGAEFTILLPLS